MTRRASIGVAVLIAIACVLPFVVSNYRTFQLTLVLVYAIALLGLNILTGYNGQISLGHGAFYAIGAYTAAVLMDRLGAPYWATLPAAGAVCLVAGFLFGLPALRLEGLYLALATFALGVSMPQLLKYHHLEKWTGGVQGIVIAKPEPPAFLREAGLQMNPDQWLYFFALAVAAMMFVLGWNLLRGRVGRALIAIRDQHIAAEAMGINNALYKSLAPTASPSSFPWFSWSGSWSAGSRPFRARSTARSSSSSCRTSRTRSRRLPRGRSSACS